MCVIICYKVYILLKDTLTQSQLERAGGKFCQEHRPDLKMFRRSWLMNFVLKLPKYRISVNSFRGNYSFLKMESVEIFIVSALWHFLLHKLNSCRGNYWKGETIKGRKLFAEIRYSFFVQIIRALEDKLLNRAWLMDYVLKLVIFHSGHKSIRG